MKLPIAAFSIALLPSLILAAPTPVADQLAERAIAPDGWLEAHEHTHHEPRAIAPDGWLEAHTHHEPRAIAPDGWLEAHTHHEPRAIAPDGWLEAHQGPITYNGSQGVQHR